LVEEKRLEGISNMSVTSKIQYAFAAHLRDPAANPAPAGIEDRRIAIYRELFYNNVEGLLKTAFPVLYKILPDEKWHRIARRFFADYRCKTPIFAEVSAEFVKYLQEHRKPEADDPPFLAELAHYEWVEMALSISNAEVDQDGVEKYGDLIEEIPVLSPLAWSLNYSFPVHKIRPDFQPEQADGQPTQLIVYRDRDDSVGFMESNAVTSRLFQLITDNAETKTPRNGHTLLLQIVEELQHPQPDAVLAGGEQIFTQMRDKDILSGARPLAS
jgi:hypothetical protein